MGEAESEKRIFKINGTTRKNKPVPKIKVKTPKNTTLKNKQLLHFIRDHQAKSERKEEKQTPPKTEFEQTMEFMKQVAKTPPFNATLKHRAIPNIANVITPPIYNLPAPKYGCLKGGILPLYRNTTFRQKEGIVAGGNPPIQIYHPTPLNNVPLLSHNVPLLSHNVPLLSHNVSSLSHNVPLLSHNVPLLSHNAPFLQQPKQIIQAMTDKMANIAPSAIKFPLNRNYCAKFQFKKYENT